jgi:hypothetical protein
VRAAALAGIIALAVVCILALAWPARSHDHYDWVRKYTNAHDVNCCGALDVVPISHETANAAQVGSTLTADFLGHPGFAVTVQRIYQTEDREGRAMLSRFGCLFRVFGS